MDAALDRFALLGVGFHMTCLGPDETGDMSVCNKERIVDTLSVRMPPRAMRRTDALCSAQIKCTTLHTCRAHEQNRMCQAAPIDFHLSRVKCNRVVLDMRGCWGVWRARSMHSVHAKVTEVCMTVTLLDVVSVLRDYLDLLYGTNGAPIKPADTKQRVVRFVWLSKRNHDAGFGAAKFHRALQALASCRITADAEPLIEVRFCVGAERCLNDALRRWRSPPSSTQERCTCRRRPRVRSA